MGFRKTSENIWQRRFKEEKQRSKVINELIYYLTFWSYKRTKSKGDHPKFVGHSIWFSTRSIPRPPFWSAVVDFFSAYIATNLLIIKRVSLSLRPFFASVTTTARRQRPRRDNNIIAPLPLGFMANVTLRFPLTPRPPSLSGRADCFVIHSEWNRNCLYIVNLSTNLFVQSTTREWVEAE